MLIETEYTNGLKTIRPNTEGWIIRNGRQVYTQERKDFRYGDLVCNTPDKDGICELLMVKQIRILSEAEAALKRMRGEI